MPYNSLISRTDAAALIPEVVSDEILNNVPQRSAVMQLARRLANMSTNQKRMPVMSALATAYFVSGDTSLKQTSEVNWDNKYIDAEELAVIVPIPEAVLDDSTYDIWGQVRPSIEEAFGIAIDAAVMYGTNIPSTWTTDLGAAGIVAGALAASQGISLAAYTDLYEAIFGETAGGTSGLFGLVEEDGFMVTGSIAHLQMKRRLRNMRDSDGGLLFSNSIQQAGAYILDGAPCLFPLNGAVSSTYYLLSGQWNQLVYAMRQDITYKILDQAVIQDGAGNIVYNLAQQDMVALRAVMRLGFALPNPINRVQGTTASRFPFAYLTA
jgi:HK97 family phage major capsid protein